MDSKLQKIQDRLSSFYEHPSTPSGNNDSVGEKRYFIHRSELLKALAEKQRSLENQFATGKQKALNSTDLIVNYLNLVSRIKQTKHDYKTRENVLDFLQSFKTVFAHV